MITYNVVNDSLLDAIKKKIVSLSNEEKDKMLRYVASSLAPVIHDRIHKAGKKADGSMISEKGYSNAYLKLRERKYKRMEGRKVVLSLTHQLENDFSIGITDPIKTEAGYGLGFKNPLNVQKSEWLESMFGTGIWDLSPNEKTLSVQVAKNFIRKFLL